MPSDPRADAAARALAAPWERFHSALAEAVEEVRSYLRSHAAPNGRDDTGGRAALGPFADGRIDAARFAALVEREEVTDADTLARMTRAFEALSALAARADGPLRIDVPPGGDLRACVERALTEVGRALGAARVAQLSRSGRYDDAAHRDLLRGIPFVAWGVGERNLAPPLVVSIDGADLRASDLAVFLDGAMKIVLVVRGPSPPAPLARLTTPGTYVLQTSDVAELAGLAAAPGPGLAALVPEDAARFRHDPSAGITLAERLTVTHVPSATPRHALGGSSVLQQTEDLRQLAELAAAAARPTAAVCAPAETAAVASGHAEAEPIASDPAGRLAAWLLQQAELPGPG